jgi:hypothetical protein
MPHTEDQLVEQPAIGLIPSLAAIHPQTYM